MKIINKIKALLKIKWHVGIKYLAKTVILSAKTIKILNQLVQELDLAIIKAKAQLEYVD